jgi:hypothetical protein
MLTIIGVKVSFNDAHLYLSANLAKEFMKEGIASEFSTFASHLWDLMLMETPFVRAKCTNTTNNASVVSLKFKTKYMLIT